MDSYGLMERMKFNARRQLEGESAFTFIKDLYELALKCDFGSHRGELVRDRIIVGIADQEVAESMLLIENLPVATAIEMAVRAEAKRKERSNSLVDASAILLEQLKIDSDRENQLDFLAGGCHALLENFSRELKESVSRTMFYLVKQCLSERRYDVAVAMGYDIVGDMETIKCDVCSRLAILGLISLAYLGQKNRYMATEVFWEAMDDCQRTLGKGHRILGNIYTILSAFYEREGTYDVAEALCRLALEIREKEVGKKHPKVAWRLSTLAMICQNLQKYQEAEKYYRRSLEILSKCYGPDEPIIVKTKRNLKTCLELSSAKKILITDL